MIKIGIILVTLSLHNRNHFDLFFNKNIFYNKFVIGIDFSINYSNTHFLITLFIFTLSLISLFNRSLQRPFFIFQIQHFIVAASMKSLSLLLHA